MMSSRGMKHERDGSWPTFQRVLDASSDRRTLNLPDAILLLKNISHFSKNSFVTLACYKTDEEKYLFEKWTLGGNLCLKREEWKQIFKEAGYRGDYLFIDSNYLNLKLQK